MGPDDTLNQETLRTNLGLEHRRPYWLIGLALLGLVVILLAGAFLLDRQLRPRVGIESPPAVATATRPTNAPVAVVPPTLPATAAPTTQPAPASTATTAAGAPTTEAPGGPRVATSPLEQEIEAAYLHYWDVLAQAYLDTDTSHLGEVMSDPELSRQDKEIQDLKSQGRAAKLVAEHRIAFAKVSPESAVIYDEYLNRSVFVDPTTKQERPTSAPPETEKISFEMRKIDGTWRVVDGTRHN